MDYSINLKRRRDSGDSVAGEGEKKHIKGPTQETPTQSQTPSQPQEKGEKKLKDQPKSFLPHKNLKIPQHTSLTSHFPPNHLHSHPSQPLSSLHGHNRWPGSHQQQQHHHHQQNSSQGHGRLQTKSDVPSPHFISARTSSSPKTWTIF